LRLGLLFLASACAPDAPTIAGYVVRDGVGVVDVAVEGAGTDVRSGPDGWFELDVGGLPVAVTAVEGQVAVSELSCVEHPVLDLSTPIARAEATLALVLRNVQGEPEFHVRYAALEGSVREPVSRTWDLPQPTWSKESGQRGVWTASLTVPVSRSWALGVTTLLEQPWLETTHHVVGQALLVTGEALGAGEVRYVDVFMSDETLRETVYWDASGPGGVEEAVLYQQVEVAPFVVELATWRGPVAEPVPVPIVLRNEGDPFLGLRAELRYAGVGDCASRVVGMNGAVVPGELAGRWVEGAPVDAVVPVSMLRFPEPYPEPPSLEIGEGARPTVGWSYVPPRDARVELQLRAGALRWSGTGVVGCVERELAWPAALAPRGTQRVTGALSWWSTEPGSGAWGRCDVVSRAR
jgi:hypothetical protein